MTKSVSIVILSVICVIALFFGVCSCLPGGLEYGEYGIYNSAINLIQCDDMFGDSVVATYKVKLDEGANLDDVLSVIRSRLSKMYGRYFSNVIDNADGEIVITVSKTANENKTSESTILAAVTTTGKVEILTEQTYAEDKVVLSSEHVKRASVQKYADGASAFHIVELRLTKEGQAIASEKLTASTSGWSAYLAIDETVTYGVVYNSNGVLQVYTGSDEDCQRLAGLIKSGPLAAKLTSVDTTDKNSVGGLVFAIIMAALILGSWIFYIVRYGKLSVAAIVSQLVVVVAFIMFAGLVYFNMLNLVSAIGIVLGYCMMSAFTILTFDKIAVKSDFKKTYASRRHNAFLDMNILNLIVHAIVLVLGAVLWLIPTGVTAPLGNALVYAAVLSFIATMGLNRLFTAFNLGLDDENGSERK